MHRIEFKNKFAGPLVDVQSTKVPKSSSWRCSIALLLVVVSSLAGCFQSPPESELQTLLNEDPTEPICGIWIRENDIYANMVMAVKQNARDDIEAELLYVPAAAVEGSFSIGDQKLRHVVRTSVADTNPEYGALSLVKSPDGSADWSEVKLHIASDDTLHSRDKVDVGREIGGSQRWRRISEDSKDMAYAYYGKAIELKEMGDLDEAARRFRTAASLAPDDAYFCNELAWLLAVSKADRLREPQTAVKLAAKACKLESGPVPNYLDTLAAAHASAGSFDEAVDFQQKAIDAISIHADREVDALKELGESSPSEALAIMTNLMWAAASVGYDIESNPNGVMAYFKATVSEELGLSGFQSRLDLYKKKRRYIE